MSREPRNRTPDDPFEQDLDAIRTAWQGLRQDEPPDLLDQSVRNAARRAVEPRKQRRSLRWLGSLATAVVVVLALAIVIRQDQQGPVPPVPKTDGFRLDDAVTTDERAADEGVTGQEPGRAELRMQRVAPTAASEAAPFRGGQAAPELLEEVDADRPPPTAEEWIEQMRQLQQAGRLQELAAQLEAFRETWPDYPLPADLQE